MPYRPQPNERKHRSLIANATAEAELAEQALDELQRAAKSDATKAFIRGIQVRVLRIDKMLNQMMEIARLEDDE